MPWPTLQNELSEVAYHYRRLLIVMKLVCIAIPVGFMDQDVLSDSGNFPCYLLHTDSDVRILLDCPIILSSLLTQSPGQSLVVSTPSLQAVDWESVDAIVLSNYMHSLALPFVTEYTRFRGKVYATEPTVQLSRQLMLELVAGVHVESRATAPTTARSAQDTARTLV